MSIEAPRITGPTLKVLGQFMSRPIDAISGSEITRATGLASGTLYPILFRLERLGWLESEWEEVAPSEVKRPRRRLYRMTATGESSARAAFKELMPNRGELVWQW